MSAGTMRSVKFRAVVDDPYDGLMRMVGDAQRFGFALEQVALEGDGVDRWAVLLALRIPHETDDSCIIARFLRHPAVHSTVLLPEGTTSIECVPVARLAA